MEVWYHPLNLLGLFLPMQTKFRLSRHKTRPCFEYPGLCMFLPQPRSPSIQETGVWLWA
jgi:hypothetical protein